MFFLFSEKKVTICLLVDQLVSQCVLPDAASRSLPPSHSPLISKSRLLNIQQISEEQNQRRRKKTKDYSKLTHRRCFIPSSLQVIRFVYWTGEDQNKKKQKNKRMFFLLVCLFLTIKKINRKKRSRNGFSWQPRQTHSKIESQIGNGDNNDKMMQKFAARDRELMKFKFTPQKTVFGFKLTSVHTLLRSRQ